MRLERKTEHIENYLKTEYIGDTLFSDVFIQHDALADLSLDEIDTSLSFLGKEMDFPLLINSMTGGADISLDINRSLASLSKEFNIGMATGSAKVALEEPDSQSTFTVVREENPSGVIIGNIGANESYESAQKVVDLLNADALQLHLNIAQELAMEDGDRTFKGILDNIGEIVDKLSVPVIVKEVGYGISSENARSLYQVGVRYIDIAGAGGSNFIEIEDLRNIGADFSDLYEWGSPTAYLLETYRSKPDDLLIISSGGIRSSLDIVKSLVMGADLVAMSGEILNYLLYGSEDYCRNFLKNLNYKTKMIMLMLNAKNLQDLKKVEYKITGRLKDLVQ